MHTTTIGGKNHHFARAWQLQLVHPTDKRKQNTSRQNPRTHTITHIPPFSTQHTLNMHPTQKTAEGTILKPHGNPAHNPLHEKTLGGGGRPCFPAQNTTKHPKTRSNTSSIPFSTIAARKRTLERYAGSQRRRDLSFWNKVSVNLLS